MAHAAALALLAWTTPALRLPSVDWPPDVTLELSPKTVRSSSPVSSAAKVQVARAPPAASAPERRREAPLPARAPQAPATVPSVPAPLSRSSTSPSAQTGSAGGGANSPSAGAQDRSGGDPRGAVRAAIGCSHEDFLRLTPAERDACLRRLGELPRGAGPRVDLIDPLKRKAYDQQAAADARRRNHDGPMSSPVIACSGVGSNFGVGCVPPEAMHSVRGGPTPRPPAPDVTPPATPDPPAP